MTPGGRDWTANAPVTEQMTPPQGLPGGRGVALKSVTELRKPWGHDATERQRAANDGGAFPLPPRTTVQRDVRSTCRQGDRRRRLGGTAVSTLRIAWNDEPKGAPDELENPKNLACAAGAGGSLTDKPLTAAWLVDIETVRPRHEERTRRFFPDIPEDYRAEEGRRGDAKAVLRAFLPRKEEE